MQGSTNKARIGIIGASSQVGSSLAFYLKQYFDADVTCFIRSSYSRYFFDMLNIPVLQGKPGEAEYKTAFESFDIVIDSSYPSGQLADIPATIARNMEDTMSLMRPGSAFIHFSSIMAYGMPMDDKQLNNFSIPRTSYAYIKRFAEKKAMATGKKYRIDVYNFRLGQVHGFLQSVSGSFHSKLKNQQSITLDGLPEDKVNIIFIHSLAEAVLQCNKLKPAIYTLVASPQWTLKELYEYYLQFFNLHVNLQFLPAAQASSRPFGFRSLISGAQQYRGLIENYVLLKSPRLATKLKGKYRIAELQKRLNQEAGVEYIDYNLIGSPSLPTIQDIHTDPAYTMKFELEAMHLYNEELKKRVKHG